MSNINTQVVTIFLNIVTQALKDYETEMVVDTSLEITSNLVPLTHVKQELRMMYQRGEEDKTLILFQYNLLSDYVARQTEHDEGLSFIFEGSVISLMQTSDGYKLYLEANSGCNEIISSEGLIKHGIDAKEIFEYLEELIKDEI